MESTCPLDLFLLRMHLHALDTILETGGNDIYQMFHEQEQPLRASAFDLGCLAISMMCDVVEETVSEMQKSPCAQAPGKVSSMKE